MKIKKLLIVLGCCIITLFSLVFVGCKRDNVKASVISSNGGFIELPSIAVYSDRTGKDNSFVPTMYLGQLSPVVDDNTPFTLSYLRTESGSETDTYLETYVFGSDTDIFLHYGYGDMIYNQGNIAMYYTTKFNNLSYYASNRFSRLTVLIQEYDSIVDIIANAVDMSVDIQWDTLTYTINDMNKTIFSFRIDHIIHTDLFTDDDGDFASFSQINVIANSNIPSQALLDNMYNTGYNKGYNNGYNNGYNVGVDDGFGATTPFDVFVDTVERFLNIELFGFFKISHLLYLTFGMILLGIVIKVFLGG